MVGDMQYIMGEYAADGKEDAAAGPVMPPSLMEIHLTPEQKSSLTLQWKESGEAAKELVFTACDGKVGSLRISGGWIVEPS